MSSWTAPASIRADLVRIEDEGRRGAGDDWRPAVKSYLLSVCYPPGGVQPSPEALETIMKDVNALNREMQEAGAWVFAGGLHPAHTATVVQYRDGEVLTTDGPFAEGKEHLGGVCVIRAPDLDAALAWARKLSRATTVPIEVWPFQEPGGG